MADLYDGAPDTRQTAAAVMAPAHSLFRKRYRQLAPSEVEFHDQIKDKADELAAMFRRVATVGLVGKTPHPDLEIHENVRRAIAHLEDAVYRAVKGLTA